MDDPSGRSDTDAPEQGHGRDGVDDATDHATTDAASHEATPSLIEIALFAPIDAAFWLLRDPGAAATRGRARVEQALRQARAIGELSVKFGARELRRRTEGAGAKDESAPKSAPRAAHPDAGPAPDEVIADYDALSASQIVPMLASLEPAERARVAAYETKSRGRQTILRKIEQLDGTSG